MFDGGKGTKKNETTKEKRDFFAFKLNFLCLLSDVLI